MDFQLTKPLSTLLPDPTPLVGRPLERAGGAHGSRVVAGGLFPACGVDGVPELSEAVSMGTTILAVECAGGVVLAADSRARRRGRTL